MERLLLLLQYHGHHYLSNNLVSLRSNALVTQMLLKLHRHPQHTLYVLNFQFAFNVVFGFRQSPRRRDNVPCNTLERCIITSAEEVTYVFDAHLPPRQILRRSISLSPSCLQFHRDILR